VVRVVLLGCRPCLVRELWAGVSELFSGFRGLLAMFVLPFALLHAVRAAFWTVALPLIGPTVWLRRSLEEAGLDWGDFLRGRQEEEARPLLDDAQRRNLAEALVVLLRDIAGADGTTGTREWAAVRSYLRFFWADEPEIAASADPGPSPSPPPTAAERAAAAAVVRASTGANDARLVLQMLLGVAEQAGGVVHSEAERLQQIALQCGFPPELVADAIGLPEPPPEPPPEPDSPWTVLGLPAGSSHAEVRSRYLQLVRENHPDRHAHLGPAFQAAATRRMAAINGAYRRLTRSKRRAGG